MILLNSGLGTAELMVVILIISLALVGLKTLLKKYLGKNK